MGDQFRLWMPDLQFRDLFQAEDLMHHTSSVPKQHIPARLFYKIGSQVTIRGKNYLLVFRNTLHDLLRIGRSTDDIAQCLYLRGAVNIGYDNMVRMLFLKSLE